MKIADPAVPNHGKEWQLEELRRVSETPRSDEIDRRLGEELGRRPSAISFARRWAVAPECFPEEARGKLYMLALELRAEGRKES